MAWSVRGAPGPREGLTIYQVQELLRTGQLGPDDEAAQDGNWSRVRDSPALARFLPDAAPTPPKEGDAVDVHGIRLQIGPDGKPLPPDAAAIAKLLAVDVAPAGPNAQQAKTLRIAIGLGLAIVVAGMALLLFRMFQVSEALR